LKRIYDKITEEKGGALFGGGTKKQIDPPEVLKVGTKRVAWSNFMGNCKRSVILERITQFND